MDVFVTADEDGLAVVVTPMDGPFKPSIRGDLDNYIKTALDGLNGVAWDDDRQVVKITAVKL